MTIWQGARYGGTILDDCGNEVPCCCGNCVYGVKLSTPFNNNLECQALPPSGPQDGFHISSFPQVRPGTCCGLYKYNRR